MDDQPWQEQEMAYKFEQLDVWKMSMEYLSAIYVLTESLPKSEEYNLKSQIIRAATSISLNIAEGSTGQSDPEQARFLGMAIRSLIETVACQHIIRQRGYVQDEALLNKTYEDSQLLARKLQAFRKSLSNPQSRIREEAQIYLEDELI